MKFWQLMSVCGANGQPDLAAEKAEGDERWRQFAEWARQEAELVRLQDRAKLDHDLPDDYVEAVLSGLEHTFYVSSNGRWLRSMKFEEGDREVSSLEAYRRYGGEAVEEASEKGTAAVGLEVS